MSFFPREKNVERIQSPGLRSSSKGHKICSTEHLRKFKNEPTSVKRTQSTPIFDKGA